MENNKYPKHSFQDIKAIALLTSTQVIRAMINELPESRAEIARIQALPVSGTYRLTTALLSKK